MSIILIGFAAAFVGAVIGNGISVHTGLITWTEGLDRLWWVSTGLVTGLVVALRARSIERAAESRE